jgi:hypothetical protein
MMQTEAEKQVGDVPDGSPKEPPTTPNMKSPSKQEKRGCTNGATRSTGAKINMRLTEYRMCKTEDGRLTAEEAGERLEYILDRDGEVGTFIKAGPIACNNGLVRITRLNNEEVSESEAWKKVEEETTVVAAAIDWMRSMLLLPKGSWVAHAIHQLKATAFVCNELCKQDKNANRVYTAAEEKLFFWSKIGRVPEPAFAYLESCDRFKKVVKESEKALGLFTDVKHQWWLGIYTRFWEELIKVGGPGGFDKDVAAENRTGFRARCVALGIEEPMFEVSGTTVILSAHGRNLCMEPEIRAVDTEYKIMDADVLTAMLDVWMEPVAGIVDVRAELRDHGIAEQAVISAFHGVDVIEVFARFDRDMAATMVQQVTVKVPAVQEARAIAIRGVLSGQGQDGNFSIHDVSNGTVKVRWSGNLSLARTRIGLSAVASQEDGSLERMADLERKLEAVSMMARTSAAVAKSTGAKLEDHFTRAMDLANQTAESQAS